MPYAYKDRSNQLSTWTAAKWVLLVFLTIGLILGALVACIWGFKAFGRSQTLADAHNNAEVARIKAANEKEVNTLRIAAQEQKVLITQQDAEIRKTQAQGIRAAQDEIAKTLTPLYVQFEMTEALKDIAVSGKNNTVIYIPTGKDGLPMVAPVK